MAKFIFNAGVVAGSPLYAASTATMIDVIDRATGNRASLWADRSGTTILANPFPMQSSGQFFFYADAGRYQITATNGTNVRVWEDVILVDPAVSGGASVVTAVASSSGVVTLNAALGSYFTMTTTENITDVVVTGLDGFGYGSSIMLKITQGATNRTATWPAEFEFTHETGKALKTGVGAVSVLALTTFDNGATFTATLGGGI